jgi:DNA-directed RNA polymerase specialized sigma24 family protein
MAITLNRIVDSARRYARREANEVAVDCLPESASGDHGTMSDSVYGDAEELRKAIQDLPQAKRRPSKCSSFAKCP